MTDNTHSINRPGSTEQTESDDSDDATEDDEQRSEAEIKRELRGSVLGEALLRRDRELRRRRGE